MGYQVSQWERHGGPAPGGKHGIAAGNRVDAETVPCGLAPLQAGDCRDRSDGHGGFPAREGLPRFRFRLGIGAFRQPGEDFPGSDKSARSQQALAGSQVEFHAETDLFVKFFRSGAVGGAEPFHHMAGGDGVVEPDSFRGSGGRWHPSRFAGLCFPEFSQFRCFAPCGGSARRPPMPGFESAVSFGIVEKVGPAQEHAQIAVDWQAQGDTGPAGELVTPNRQDIAPGNLGGWAGQSIGNRGQPGRQAAQVGGCHQGDIQTIQALGIAGKSQQFHGGTRFAFQQGPVRCGPAGERPGGHTQPEHRRRGATCQGRDCQGSKGLPAVGTHPCVTHAIVYRYDKGSRIRSGFRVSA